MFSSIMSIHPSNGPSPRARHGFLVVLEFLLYALLAALMLHATWLTWPDAFIDFSRELYLPWRVSCGDLLYRDVAYDFGPLSVYANTALFALLGRPSIHALFALNFVFWIATLLALRALLRRMAHPAVATLAVALFVLLFSFNRYLSCGNFNYLSPYSHELPRGLLLALGALLALDSAIRHRSATLSLSAGFLLGLVLFTKPEIAVSSVMACCILFILSLLRGLGRIPALNSTAALFGSASLRRVVLPFALGLLVALSLVLVPFAIALRSVSRAFRDALFNLYSDCLNPSLSSLLFYRKTLGVDDIPAHAFRLLRGALCAFLPFLAGGLLLPRISARPFQIAFVAIIASMAAIVGFHCCFLLNSALALAPVLFCLWGRGRPATETSHPSFGRAGLGRSPLAIAFSSFAFVLVTKMLLNATITFYGFVLALPAFCCAVLLFFRPPCPFPRAAIALALLVGFSAAAIRLQTRTLRHWDVRHPVHDSAYLVDPLNAQAFGSVLAWLRGNTRSGSTLAVLPEGAILNVLSDRPNPTPYVYLSQGDWLRLDSSAVLGAYSNALPDTLVLVRKAQDSEFGIDYATDLMAFLDPLYSPAFTFSVPTPEGPVPNAG